VPITEREAREKWCHESFSGARAKCIGSDCMAWRWTEGVPQICIQCGTEDTTWENRPEERRGFCGLSGVPKW